MPAQNIGAPPQSSSNGLSISNNSHIHPSEEIRQQYESQDQSCDLSIFCRDGTMKCHSSVLYVKPSKNNGYVSKCTQYQFKLFLDFLYHGKVFIPHHEETIKALHREFSSFRPGWEIIDTLKLMIDKRTSKLAFPRPEVDSSNASPENGSSHVSPPVLADEKSTQPKTPLSIKSSNVPCHPIQREINLDDPSSSPTCSARANASTTSDRAVEMVDRSSSSLRDIRLVKGLPLTPANSHQISYPSTETVEHANLGLISRQNQRAIQQAPQEHDRDGSTMPQTGKLSLDMNSSESVSNGPNVLNRGNTVLVHDKGSFSGPVTHHATVSKPTTDNASLPCKDKAADDKNSDKSPEAPVKSIQASETCPKTTAPLHPGRPLDTNLVTQSTTQLMPSELPIERYIPPSSINSSSSKCHSKREVIRPKDSERPTTKTVHAQCHKSPLSVIPGSPFVSKGLSEATHIKSAEATCQTGSSTCSSASIKPVPEKQSKKKNHPTASWTNNDSHPAGAPVAAKTVTHHLGARNPTPKGKSSSVQTVPVTENHPKKTSDFPGSAQVSRENNAHSCQEQQPSADSSSPANKIPQESARESVAISTSTCPARNGPDTVSASKENQCKSSSPGESTCSVSPDANALDSVSANNQSSASDCVSNVLSGCTSADKENQNQHRSHCSSVASPQPKTAESSTVVQHASVAESNSPLNTSGEIPTACICPPPPEKIVISPDKLFTCDVCGRSFRLNVQLNKHKRVHFGEKRSTDTVAPVSSVPSAETSTPKSTIAPQPTEVKVPSAEQQSTAALNESADAQRSDKNKSMQLQLESPAMPTPANSSIAPSSTSSCREQSPAATIGSPPPLISLSSSESVPLSALKITASKDVEKSKAAPQRSSSDGKILSRQIASVSTSSSAKPSSSESSSNKSSTSKSGPSKSTSNSDPRNDGSLVLINGAGAKSSSKSKKTYSSSSHSKSFPSGCVNHNRGDSEKKSSSSSSRCSSSQSKPNASSNHSKNHSSLSSSSASNPRNNLNSEQPAKETSGQLAVTKVSSALPMSNRTNNSKKRKLSQGQEGQREAHPKNVPSDRRTLQICEPHSVNSRSPQKRKSPSELNSDHASSVKQARLHNSSMDKRRKSHEDQEEARKKMFPPKK